MPPIRDSRLRSPHGRTTGRHVDPGSGSMVSTQSPARALRDSLTLNKDSGPDPSPQRQRHGRMTAARMESGPLCRKSTEGHSAYRRRRSRRTAIAISRVLLGINGAIDRAEKPDHCMHGVVRGMNGSDGRTIRPVHGINRPDHRMNRPGHATNRAEDRAIRPEHRGKRSEHRVNRPNGQVNRPNGSVNRPNGRLNRPNERGQ